MMTLPASEVRPPIDAGYRLLHDGVIALSQVEANGMKVDEEYLNAALTLCKDQITALREQLTNGKVWVTWRKMYGPKSNLTSNAQLLKVLEKLGFELESADESELEKVDIKFVQRRVKLTKLIKAKNTYLQGIKTELVDGYIHPHFHLHTVVTYRSSASNPSVQNNPVRNPEVAELIRRSYVSRFGDEGVLVENDFKGAEVNVSACYHKDPVFIKYITDPAMDMHRDMAAQLYKLPVGWVKEHGKLHRYGAKNKFVFPQFYGDYYVACAKALWEWAERANLQAPGGITLLQWLAKHGITRRGPCNPEERYELKKDTFEYHVKQVEKDFWGNRFMVYGQWKEDWYAAYQKVGFFETLTGFRIEGVFGKNEVTNYPVQGSAFHCLLWCLIRINRLLRKYKMKSVLASQVHDSILGDVHVKELNQYLEIVHQVVMVDLRAAWDWIIVPMVIETEICPVGSSWYDKQEVIWKDGIYTFKVEEKKVTLDNAEAFLKAFKRTSKYTQNVIRTGKGKYATHESID